MKFKTLLMLCFIGLGITHLRGQNSEKASLSELFEKAKHYPGLKAKTAQLEAANLNIKIVKRDYLPTLDLQAQNSFGTYEGSVGGFFPSPGIFNVSGEGRHDQTAINTVISATAKWDFLQFGKHKDAVKTAQVQQEKAENEFALSHIDLKHQIAQVYLHWQYSQFMLNWADKEQKRRREILNLSKSLVRSGLSSAADSLAAKTEWQKVLALQNKWQAEVYGSRQEIQEYSGFLPAVNDTNDVFLTLRNNDFNAVENSTHPLIISKEKQEDVLRIQEKNIAHQALPNLSLLAGGLLRGTGFSDYHNAFRDSYELPVNNYLIGFGLTWQIDNFYTKGLKKKRIGFEQAKIAEEKKAIQKHLAQKEISLKQHILQSAEEIKHAENAYHAAKKSYELFKVRYQKGLIDLTTLLQIQQTLQFTEKSKITAYYHYWQYQNKYAYINADYSHLTQIFN